VTRVSNMTQAGIGLTAVGAILRFAINLESPVVAVDIIGVILMVAGVFMILLGLFSATGKTRTERSVSPDGGHVVEETHHTGL
jgi:sulfite exporter TauE/SafE